MSLDQLTAQVKEKVGANSGLDATVRFDFGDDGVIFVDGKSVPNSVSNEAKDAECTIKISMENFGRMVRGELDPTMAFMMGQLKVSGNMGVAMKLSKVL
jgi:putative sterol carrier protein